MFLFCFPSSEKQEDNQATGRVDSAEEQAYKDRYQLNGETLGGRKLKIIFQLTPSNVVRIITGWPL